ncbi:DUF1467 family protein [Litoreibacter arenae]|uniref:Glycine/D-amino acid oxidase (Deaminating) n=1 Tax=Litoreibacter arenae DSM 19593 TaxID=1123360 RepID=S9QJ95_9RHOB|nr:DUF1467 family protein [Litoreibacter arenae]EPX81516.1 Glycine/D-amino acid oxidase (deaminating) [Litoreibacter arenae DSM 19593]
MALTSAIVVFAVTWFLVLFCVLPFGTPSQGEMGEVSPGTPSSAPANARMKRKFLITTLIAFVIWVPLCLGIIYGYINADTMNLYKRFGPDS